MVDSGDVKEQHRLQFRVPLHEPLRKKGLREAARELGIARRTVAAYMDERVNVLADEEDT